MKEFLLKIGSKLRTFHTEKFSKYQTKEIDELIVSHLGLSDLGKLRDKFEGESFRLNKTKMILSYLSVCSYLKIKPISLLKIDLDNFKPEVEYKNQKFRIICSDFGSFPALEKDLKLPFIYVVCRSVLDYKIIGYSSGNLLKNPKSYQIDNLNRKIFKSIEMLNNFSDEK
tara:strand:- start:3260 stop:3769 length:510 start_codon:yes stop_codon:yes gene_type:complete